MRLILVLIALHATAPLAAQVLPRPAGSDTRIQFVDYDPDQVIAIQAVQGYQITLQFGSDEKIENVAIGDSVAWQATANHRGDLLFVKLMQYGITTNLTVATDVRIYAFELSPALGGSADIAYIVRFRYPSLSEKASAPAMSIGEFAGSYRLSGARALRPSRIGNDGIHTYIKWPERRPLPAVYDIDDREKEALVNGYMRDGYYVIDGVPQSLMFRIDGRVARAVRMIQQGLP